MGLVGPSPPNGGLRQVSQWTCFGVWSSVHHWEQGRTFGPRGRGGTFSLFRWFSLFSLSHRSRPADLPDGMHPAGHDGAPRPRPPQPHPGECRPGLLSVGLNGYERVVKVPRLPGPGEQPVVGRRPPAGWKKGNPEENVGPSSLTPHHPQKIQIQILLSSSSQALPRTSLFQQRTSLPPL